jgi:5'-phosphate synthase pdxT subunit
VALAGVHRVVVAARQGTLLGTAFHPEITHDTRWHQLFLGMCLAAASEAR